MTSFVLNDYEVRAVMAAILLTIRNERPSKYDPCYERLLVSMDAFLDVQQRLGSDHNNDL